MREPNPSSSPSPDFPTGSTIDQKVRDFAKCEFDCGNLTTNEPGPGINPTLFLVLFTFTPLAATAGPLVAGALDNPLHTFVLMAAVHLLNIAYIAGWLDALAPEEGQVTVL